MIPEQFVRALDVFESVLAAAKPDQWSAPSPCEDWSAIDVAGHVTAGLLVVEARALGRPLPEHDPDFRELAGDAPLASWRATRAAMMATLTPEALDRSIQLAFGLNVTLREWLERYPLELLVHTWDLAQAIGHSVELPDDLLLSALRTAEEFVPVGREAGMIGPELPVPDDASPRTRLLALFGRQAPVS